MVRELLEDSQIRCNVDPINGSIELVEDFPVQSIHRLCRVPIDVSEKSLKEPVAKRNLISGGDGRVRHKPSPGKSKSGRGLVQVQSKSEIFPHKSDLSPSLDLGQVLGRK